jgi:hypothetical protein
MSIQRAPGERHGDGRAHGQRASPGRAGGRGDGGEGDLGVVPGAGGRLGQRIREGAQARAQGGEFVHRASRREREEGVATAGVHPVEGLEDRRDEQQRRQGTLDREEHRGGEERPGEERAADLTTRAEQRPTEGPGHRAARQRTNGRAERERPAGDPR